MVIVGICRKHFCFPRGALRVVWPGPSNLSVCTKHKHSPWDKVVSALKRQICPHNVWMWLLVLNGNDRWTEVDWGREWGGSLLKIYLFKPVMCNRPSMAVVQDSVTFCDIGSYIWDTLPETAYVIRCLTKHTNCTDWLMCKLTTTMSSSVWHLQLM